jgi:hypothetical protein
MLFSVQLVIFSIVSSHPLLEKCAQSKQSARPYVQSSELPPPHPQASGAPLNLWLQGGDTLAFALRRRDRHSVLYVHSTIIPTVSSLAYTQ